MSEYYTPIGNTAFSTTSYYAPMTQTETTYTSTPVTTTTVLGSGVETAYGTNTAAGFFGGGQANIVAADNAVSTGYNYNAYDYGTEAYDYEAPKKKSIFSLRNILLCCGGLLLSTLLLGGLAWLLRHLRNKSKNVQPFVQPVAPLPQVVPTQRPVVPPFPVINPRPVGLVEPIRPPVNFINPSQIVVNPQPLITPQPIITQPVIVDQPITTRPVVVDQPIATTQILTSQATPTLPALSASDIQQLLAFTSTQGPLSDASLAQLGLTEDQYLQMLRNAFSSGVLTREQAAYLGLPTNSGVVGSLSNAASRVGNVFSSAFGRAAGRSDPLPGPL